MKRSENDEQRHSLWGIVNLLSDLELLVVFEILLYVLSVWSSYWREALDFVLDDLVERKQCFC